MQERHLRVPGQPQNLVIDGSPLAIIGVFVNFLRARFAPGNGPPAYPWDPDSNKTKIFIASAFEEEGNATRDKNPALWVDKDESSYGKVMVGDQVAHRFQTSQEYQACLSTVPVSIQCVARRRSESAFLGDVVQWSLYASSDIIQSNFGIYDMTTPTLSRTTAHDKPGDWATAVSFQVSYYVAWTYVPVAPILQDIKLQLQESGLTATDYFVNIALGVNGPPPIPEPE